MPERDAKEILQKYTDGTATDEEKRWVETWYIGMNSEADPVPHDQLIQDKAASLSALLKHIRVNRRRILWPRIAAAAAILLIVSAFFFYRSGENPEVFTKIRVEKRVVPPGGNKAMLTLFDGRKVDLEDAKLGELAEQSGITISKTASGQLIYTIKETAARTPSTAYNTIETSNGGQYQVQLPDGSKVWLNAASSLTYPVSFKGRKERRVELKGEGYFEIAEDKRHPFRVVSAGQEVTVLGTHFNISSYTDEPIVKTTLLEGSVSVSSNSDNKKLVPGQQSAMVNGKFSVAVVNPDEAVAWKNGYFQFEQTDLESVMRQISRWYDVKIKYLGDVPRRRLTGKIYRNVNLDEALQLLTYFKVKFRVDSKTVIVEP